MRVAAVSGDLLVKLALTAAGVALAVWAVRRLAATGSGVVTAVGDGLYAVSPTNNDNIIYRATNTVTGGTPDYPLGSRIYDWVHPAPSPRMWPATPSPVYAQPQIGQIGNTDGVNYSLF